MRLMRLNKIELYWGRNFSTSLGFLFFLMLASCTLPTNNKVTSQSQTLLIDTVSLYDYDSEYLYLKIKGQFNTTEVTSLNEVAFYNSPDCSGAKLGSGLHKDFKNEGLILKSTLVTKLDIYTKTNTLGGCYYASTYTPDLATPPPPTLSSTKPTSPSKVSYQPALIGTAVPLKSQVQFFDDSGCSHKVGEGTASDFSREGIGISLAPNTLSQIYGMTTDPLGHHSFCTLLGSYQHTTAAPPPPTYQSFTPISPNNSSTTPNLIGDVAPEVTKVYLFSDAACQQPLTEGTGNDFKTLGFSFTVNANSITTIYAKAEDTDSYQSVCTYLATYIHDVIPPNAPAYASATPVSPTRLTTFPRLKGTASTLPGDDTVVIKLYNSSLCLTQLAGGSKAEFESTGLLTNVGPNAITSIYAQAFDAAGNSSNCTYFTDYTHTNLPPDPPVFGTTNPISPNNISITPLISGGLGNSFVPITQVQFYSNDTCSTQIGSGTAAEYTSTGVQISVPTNSITTVHGITTDQAGNRSNCAVLSNYAYSNLPAPDPSFSYSIPVSPSRTSWTPWFVGSAASTVAKVFLYRDNLCTNEIGSASKLVYSSIGLQAILPTNTITPIYGRSLDIYGNDSSCVLLTQYIHTDILPKPPIYGSMTPVSPNNYSYTPTLNGSIQLDPAAILPPTQMRVYDSSLCLSQIGTGTTSSFSNSGINLILPSNAITEIYSRSFDDAGNGSACTLMTSYTHDALTPGSPIFISTTPASPSYSEKILVKGAIGLTTDFLAPDLVQIHTDSTCTQLLAQGTPAEFMGTGVSATTSINTTSSLYGRVKNPAGSYSPCTALSNFTHANSGPAGINASNQLDGSIKLNWLPDLTASPTPTYIVKRSLQPGGPYTIMTWGIYSNNYIDPGAEPGKTYYYRVAAQNNTGTSLNSTEVALTATSPSPAQPINLIAAAITDYVSLNWNGFSSDYTYEVRRSTQPGGPYDTVSARVFGTTYMDTGITNGTAYYYRVIGKNPAGRSLFSNEAQALPLDVSNPPPHVSLTLVPNVCSGNYGAVLTWSNSEYATGFELTYNQGGVTVPGGAVPNQILGNQFTVCYFDTTFPAKVALNIRAWWGSTRSAASNIVKFRGESPPQVTVYPGDNVINLNWSGGYANNYIIKRATQAGGPYTTLTTTHPVSAYTDTAVINGQQYFYVIQGDYGTDGLGIPSFEATGQPGLPPSATPTLKLVLDPATKKPSLTWTPILPNNYYNIYRAASPGGPFSVVFTSQTPSYIDSSPLSGLNYYYVTAVWGGFETPISNTVSYRSGIPTGLTLTPSTTQLTLNWTGVAGASDYKVYRSTQSLGPYTLLASPVTNSYIDSTAGSGVGYFYVVQSHYGDGTSSPFSSEVSGMRTLSNVPSGLTVVAYNGTSVTLKWAAIASATKYKISKATALGGPYSVVAQPTTNSGSVSSLTPLTQTYYFKVKSVVGGTDSADSTVLAVVSKTEPAAPATTPGLNTVNVLWMGVGADTYFVQRSTDGTTFATIASGLTVTNFDDNSATNGQIYYYRIGCNYSDSSVLYSPISTGVTPGSVPPIPQGLAVTGNANGTDLLLSWGTVSGATSYRVYMSSTSGGPYGLPVTSTTLPTDVLITGLTADTPYYFVVTALTGNAETGFSNEIKAIPQSRPPAPTLQTATTPSIQVDWSPIAGAVSYNLERSLDSITFSTIATGIVTTTFIDTTVQNYHMYSYRYVPIRADATAMVESVSTALIATGTSALPPQNLHGISPNSNQVDLAWNLVPDTNSYIIKRGTSPGGPYTPLGTVSAAISQYIDPTVTPGTTYYYVITDTNSDGNESPPSNELPVTPGLGTTNITATPANNLINLTWDSVPGASSYNLLRGETSGGPYGLIASGIIGTSYADSQIENGVTYYYLVTATFPGGSNSTASSEISATGMIQVNLQVPIEMVDQGLSSDTTPQIFERSQTSLDTTSYDGTVTYHFEVVATNSDSTTRSIELLDSNGNVLTNLSVPPGTGYPTRLRTPFNPNLGYDIYRIQLPATTSGSQLEIHSARLIVTQMGATKTKIYIPLLASHSGPTMLDGQAPLENITALNYTSLPQALSFIRDVSKFQILPEFNAWELETVTAVDPGTTGVIGFINKNFNVAISRTEGHITSSLPKVLKSPFDEGGVAFSNPNHLNAYEVSGYCYTGCQSGGLKIYKAGLWVVLNSIIKGEVNYRIGLGEANLMSTKVIEGGRALIDTSIFSNPNVYFQSQVTIGTGGASSFDVTLVADGANDSDLTSLISIAGSTLNFATTNKTVLTTPAPLPINSGWRYLPQINPIGGSGNYGGSSILIRFNAN